VFPTHRFLSPASPFPTRWLPRLVRHFSSGTMRMLRLPTARPLALRFPSNKGYLLDSSFFRSPRVSGVPPAAPGRWSTGLASPLRFFLSWRKSVGSLMFPENPFVRLPCSQTPVGSPRQALAAFRCCPRCQDDEGSSIDHYFEAQSHGFRTAPYASCRHR
jgi:hypothetical protein